jgi:pseudouridine synthase
METPVNTIKLHAFMAHQGVASRREAEKLIDQGAVLVNGEIAHVGQRIDPMKDEVIFKGKIITSQETEKRYFLVNKPVGVVSTTEDELGRPTVLKLLPKSLAQLRLYPVGRLDQDSQGLMLLTNDGDLTFWLTHPSHEVYKTYQVRVTSHPSSKALDHLRRGVKLKEGYTQPAQVEVLDEDTTTTLLEIKISEGKHRQVRRMMDRVGYPVITLKRTAIGPLHLDQLDGQQVLEVTAEEIADAFPHLAK